MTSALQWFWTPRPWDPKRRWWTFYSAILYLYVSKDIQYTHNIYSGMVLLILDTDTFISTTVLYIICLRICSFMIKKILDEMEDYYGGVRISETGFFRGILHTDIRCYFNAEVMECMACKRYLCGSDSRLCLIYVIFSENALDGTTIRLLIVRSLFSNIYGAT